MPLPGQYFCKSCMRPIPNLRNEGKCDSCIAKENMAIRGGVFCDHCGTNGAKDLIYMNRKTKKRYCVECRATFQRALMMKGMPPDDAIKIMIQDFVLLNDPLKKKKRKR